MAGIYKTIWLKFIVVSKLMKLLVRELQIFIKASKVVESDNSHKNQQGSTLQMIFK